MPSQAPLLGLGKELCTAPSSAHPHPAPTTLCPKKVKAATAPLPHTASARWDVVAQKASSRCTCSWAQRGPCHIPGLPSLVGPRHRPRGGLDSSSQSSEQETITQGHDKKKLPVHGFLFEKLKGALRGCWFGWPYWGGVGEPQAGPSPGASSAMDPFPQPDTAHVAKFTAGPCQAFWGRSRGRDLARSPQGSRRGWQAARCLPLPLPCANERVTQREAFILR